MSGKRFGMAALLIVLLGGSAVAAETFPDVPSPPPPTGTPALGEVVVDQEGRLSPNFKKVETCTLRGCRVVIFDLRTEALVYVDRLWAKPYAPSGKGDEIVRVQAFSDAERPRKPTEEPPSKSTPGPWFDAAGVQ